MLLLDDFEVLKVKVDEVVINGDKIVFYKGYEILVNEDVKNIFG